MQLSDIRTAVATVSGYSESDALSSAATLNSLINVAHRTVSSKMDWDWDLAVTSIPLVAGQTDYALPADFKKVDRVEIPAEGRSMKLVTPRQASQYLDSTSAPAFYYVQAGQLVITPIPDAGQYTVEVTYFQAPAELVNDTDEPRFPDWAIDTIVFRAATLLTSRLDDTGQMRLMERQERSSWDALVGESMRRRGQPIVKSRRDWWV